MMFQFHKGSIRTSTERKNQTAQTRFNSIKVQLELKPTSLRYRSKVSFNSIKVQLERFRFC